MFDFCVTGLVFLGYLTYIPDLKAWFATHNFPYANEIVEMNSDALMLIVVVVAAFILVGKAYLLGIVWSCYKYLVSYEQQAAHGLYGTLHEDGSLTDVEMLLPPKYEDAIRTPVTFHSNDELAPPPPYSN